MVLIADPEEPSPSERELAQSFGLSPAESRLAAALMAGKRLSDVTIESGVQISTLRTQLTSINKKVGVKRQADLVRVFSLIPAVGAGTVETK
jgi:DNA-binding CsgD family transcriptional regulator